MIITVLNQYYNILAKDENIDIPLYGFSKEKIYYAFCIDKTSTLIGIIPLEQKIKSGKKEILYPKIMTVPQQAKKSVNIIASFLCDNASYAIGLPKSDELKEIKKTEKRFSEFKKLHHLIIDGKGSDLGDIFLKFLDTYSYEQYQDILKPYKERLMEGGLIGFQVDGKFLHEDEYLKELWLDAKEEESKDAKKMMCLATAKKTSITRLHPSIKGVKDGQSSGGSIISFNAPAYTSYNKEKGYNAPVSEIVTFNYTTVLNYLLASQNQKIQIGDATTVFWAESSKPIYSDFMNVLLNPPIGDKHNSKVKDIETEAIIHRILELFKSSQKIDLSTLDIEPSTNFYILGLSPNASRISIRFFYVNTFISIIERVLMHYQDFEIEKQFLNNPSSIPIWLIINETVNPKTNEKPNPLLSGSLMRSIIGGSMYPRTLLTTIINRIRCDRDDDNNKISQINYIRVSIIKGYLCRYIRIYKKHELKEVLTMSLNEQSVNTPYLLGRLFAVLEKAQKDALGKSINSTIKDKYFSSACATPASVFPTLLKLAQSHISKSEYGYISDKRISEIMEMMKETSFPSHLSLEDQGIFIIGYYHQSNAFYKKNEKDLNN